MENIQAILDKAFVWLQYFVTNYDVVVTKTLALLGVASIIARCTPTKVDDLWIGKLISWIGLTRPVKK